MVCGTKRFFFNIVSMSSLATTGYYMYKSPRMKYCGTPLLWAMGHLYIHTCTVTCLAKHLQQQAMILLCTCMQYESLETG